MLLCAACAATPEASRDRDSEARRFEPVTRDAVIYIYRPDAPGTSRDTTLWVDGRLVGASLPRTYFRVIVFAGRNVIDTSAPDTGKIVIRTQPSDVAYVEMRTSGGYEGSPSSSFRLMPDEAAKQAIGECCTMLETWRQGQPRLLW